MSEWFDEKLRVARLVRGFDGNGAVAEACKRGYKRALFFTNAFADLEGFASHVGEAALEQGLALADGLPGRKTVAAICRGEEPVALRSLLILIDALTAIRDGKPGNHRKRRDLQEILQAEYSREGLLQDGSIEPSFHSPDPAMLTQIRTTIAGDLGPRDFSAKLMRGAFKSGRAEQAFYGHLEDGYSSETSKVRHVGWYRLTEQAATLLHRQLMAFDGAQEHIPELDIFAPISAVTGPREGHSSKGLRRSWGNGIP